MQDGMDSYDHKGSCVPRIWVGWGPKPALDPTLRKQGLGGPKA